MVRLYVDFKGRRFYKPFKCLCCGVEVSTEQFCYGRTCAYCDLGRCANRNTIEKGHQRKDIFENAKIIPEDKLKEAFERIEEIKQYG